MARETPCLSLRSAAVPLRKGDNEKVQPPSPRHCPPYEGGQPRSEATGRGSLTSRVESVFCAKPGADAPIGAKIVLSSGDIEDDYKDMGCSAAPDFVLRTIFAGPATRTTAGIFRTETCYSAAF